MKKFKLTLLLIIAAFIGLFVYQNLAVFTHLFNLKLNIGIKHYEMLNIQSSLIFLSLFLLGFLLAYFLSLGERLKARRDLKSNSEKIKDMEEELRMLKSVSATSESAIVEDITPEDVVSEENASEERT
ncbi:MAG: DUF1049 domain-containing protein [Deltaproteobacteria bacterium]|nr:DUF1049 domain-containing protein [Deltaproteobacteria bacterium]